MGRTGPSVGLTTHNPFPLRLPVVVPNPAWSWRSVCSRSNGYCSWRPQIGIGGTTPSPPHGGVQGSRGRELYLLTPRNLSVGTWDSPGGVRNPRPTQAPFSLCTVGFCWPASLGTAVLSWACSPGVGAVLTGSSTRASWPLAGTPTFNLLMEVILSL